MTNIEAKALALVNGVKTERGRNSYSHYTRLSRALDDGHEALCRAIEQHEAFKQNVSDAVADYKADQPYVWKQSASDYFCHFIIPAPKPDPLVEVLDKMLRRRFLDPLPDVLTDEAHWLRAELEARGLEIRSKNDD